MTYYILEPVFTRLNTVIKILFETSPDGMNCMIDSVKAFARIGRYHLPALKITIGKSGIFPNRNGSLCS